MSSTTEQKAPSPPADLHEYLQPTPTVDSDYPSIIEYARETAATADPQTPREIARRLFYAVRDAVRYDPYSIVLTVERLRASTTLAIKRGWCVPKAALLAACCRVVGIPARLGYADVRNHLNTEKLLHHMGTDVFTYHGYTELYLQGKWVKATPAFNRSLCDKFQVSPPEFEGKNDSIFQPFYLAGDKHMEYLCFHGHFADFPFENMLAAFKKTYPGFFENEQVPPPGDDSAWDS